MCVRLILVLLMVTPCAAWGGMWDGVSRISLASGVARTESRECSSCHSMQFALWVRHTHSHFLIDPATDARWISARWGKRVEGWQQWVEGKFQPDEVALAYGVMGIQIYFRRDPDGHRVLPAQWNLKESRWEPLSPEVEQFRAGGKTWEARCAGCHTTGFSPMDGTFVEANVACRACHGDGTAHRTSGGLEPILRPSSLKAKKLTDLCGSCHSRYQERATGLPFVAGFQPGDALLERVALREPKPGRITEYFWSDGIERRPFMEYQGFVQSRHYQEGIHCVTCHLPHGSEEPSGLRRKSDEICNSCHDDANGRCRSHREHPAGKALCVDCHMAVSNSDRPTLRIRTHSFRFMEELTAGEGTRPSACTVACHAGRGSTWVQRNLGQWRAKD